MVPTCTPSGRLAFELQGGLDAAAAPRRAIVAGNGRLPDTIRKDVLLLVTELVSNAVWHPTPSPGDESGGWGLFLVDRITYDGEDQGSRLRQDIPQANRKV
jgi:hypothetical protein